MNEVLRQARTDLRRLRWWLLLWAVALASATSVSVLKLDLLAGDAEMARRILGAQIQLLNAVTVIGWVLAARVVHADPLDGTTAFWLTRPIAPVRLFSAKIGLIIGLFVLVPAGTMALSAGANGLRGTLALRFFAESALVHLVFVFAIVLLATLTRDIARLVLAGIVASIGWLSLHALLFAALAPAPMLERALARYSGLLVGALLFCAGCCAIVAAQYLTRRSRRSFVAAVALVVATVAVIDLWPVNFFFPRPPIAHADLDPSAVSVSLAPLRVNDRSLRSHRTYLQTSLDAQGVPAGWAVVPIGIRATLAFAGGPALAFADDTWLGNVGTYENVAVLGVEASSLQAVGHAARGRWLNNPWAERSAVFTAFEAPTESVRDRRGQPALYRATVTCEAFQAAVPWALPLRPGSEARVAGLETTILGVRRSQGARAGDSIELEARSVRPQLLFPRPVPGITYVLRNRERGELVVGVIDRQLYWNPRFTTVALDVRYDRIVFGSARTRQRLAIDDEWLAAAELLVVALEPKGTFTKTVTIPDVRLPAADGTAEK